MITFDKLKSDTKYFLFHSILDILHAETMARFQSKANESLRCNTVSYIAYPTGFSFWQTSCMCMAFSSFVSFGWCCYPLESISSNLELVNYGICLNQNPLMPCPSSAIEYRLYIVYTCWKPHNVLKCKQLFIANNI